ncbi:MAG: hypothetical protein PHI66_01340 [Candidatus Pacebacteria bacterium]|nr:hypothetical protein [Candidatus Paceibacterota bacterium]
MSEILEKLFHSKAEVKIIRLFLNDTENDYSMSDISSKTKESVLVAKKEVLNLEKIGFLSLIKKDKKISYKINANFPLHEDLKKLFFKASPASSDKIKSRIEKIGQVRLVLISGSLINSDKGRVDILIVGDSINKNKLIDFLSDIEAEVGRNIRYVYMTHDEFKYRKNMFDKFIIDILEGPNKILIDKLGSSGRI